MNHFLKKIPEKDIYLNKEVLLVQWFSPVVLVDNI